MASPNILGITRGHLYMFSGPPKSGKTWTLIGHGVSAIRHDGARGSDRVVFTTEYAGPEIARRMEIIKAPKYVRERFHVLHFPQAAFDLTVLEETILQRNPVLAIVDTNLKELTPLQVESLREMAVRHSCAIIVGLQHTYYGMH